MYSTAASYLISIKELLNTMVREAEEEAGISKIYTRANLKGCGTGFYQCSGVTRSAGQLAVCAIQLLNGASSRYGAGTQELHRRLHAAKPK